MQESIDHAIFFHMPKAGGTTLHRIVEEQYPRDRVFTIEVVNKTELTTQRFIDLEPEQRERIRLLKGHMRFGLHRHFRGNVKYFTILREPADRIVSFYYYVKATPNNRLHERVESEKMTLEDFVLNIGAGDVNNGQARLLAGFGVPDSEILAKARSHLENHFAVAGILEKYDVSLLLMKIKLGWPSYPFYERRNVNKARKKLSELPEGLIETIREKNRMDVELYRFASDLLEREIRRRGWRLKKELLVFDLLRRWKRRSNSAN